MIGENVQGSLYHITTWNDNMITIGSRKSKLAMWQAEIVAGFLNDVGMETKISSMETNW